jgi:hypothetical protein
MKDGMEEAKQGNGHWHIEGFCTLKAGRTWVTKQAGCQADGTDDPNESAAYNSSLSMVRDHIKTVINN